MALNAYPITVTADCPSCCGGEKCSQLECSSRGGEAVLCGWPENPGYESTPPRFYLKRQMGGAARVCTCPPGGCDNVDLDNPTSCEQTAIGSNGCTYFVRIEILDIFLDGGVYKYTARATFTHAGTDCAVLAEARTNAGALFYFGSSDGSATVTVNTTSGSVCFPGGDTTIFASITANVAVPGVPGGLGCTVGVYRRVSYITETKIVSYEGEATYDPAVSCDVLAVNSGKRKDSECDSFVCSESHAACGGTLELAVQSAFDPGDTYLNAVLSPVVVTATDRIQNVPDPVCGPGVSVQAQAGSERWDQLQREDTDEDALARLLAGPGGVWSDYQIVLDGSGETCENPECCRAAWGIRVDRTYEYRDARWRATQLAPEGTALIIRITYRRRAMGSTGPWAALYTDEYEGTADSEGKFQVTGNVPNDEGFETYATCTYETVPAPPP